MNSKVKSFFFICVLMLGVTIIQAQVGIGTSSVEASAKLQIDATNKGFLPPRMSTSDRNLIASPATGLVIFNTVTNALEIRTSSGWSTLKPVDYPSLSIGTQNWMEKNLEVTSYQNGDAIPYVTDPTAWAGLTTGAWCYYNNDPTSGFGKLYNWYAVADSRGLCPAGWHVPSDNEFTILTDYLGGLSVAGGKMKTTGTTRWVSPNAGATNSSGFAGLPSGYRSETGAFSDLYYSTLWWTSTQHEVYPTFARDRYVDMGYSNLISSFHIKKSGYPVRCIKD